MIAELVAVLIVIVAVKLALWAAYSGRADHNRGGDRAVLDQARAVVDQAQALLALLCEQVHERLKQDGTPPRTVINLTAGQWHEVTER